MTKRTPLPPNSEVPMTPIEVRCGNRSCFIQFAKWDASRSVGVIQVRDEDDNWYTVESDGLAVNEQINAVFSDLMHRMAASDATPPAIRAAVKTLKMSAPYGEMCRDPNLCIGKGYCPRDPTCGD